MARLSSVPSPSLMPTRRMPSPAGHSLPGKPRKVGSFVPAGDDPLDLLAVEISGKIAGSKPSLTAHGKPTGGLPVFGERRAPARRAAYRTPPR